MKIDKTLILNEIKSHYNIKSDTEFADFLGIKPQVLSNWKSRNSFDYDLVYTKCLEIDANWLLTGKGAMLKNTQIEETENLIIDLNIGSRIKALRSTTAMKQKDLADLLNCDQSQFSKIENDKLYPTLLQVIEIGKVFNKSLDYIVLGKEESASEDYKELYTMAKEQIEILKENKQMVQNELSRIKSIQQPSQDYNSFVAEPKPKLKE